MPHPKGGIKIQEQASNATRVLMLCPSNGLGGGIERYVETLEWALSLQRIYCQRVNLKWTGLRAHAAMLNDGRRLLRMSSAPVRLVVGHRTLLPVASLLAREDSVCGIWALCYGQELWTPRYHPRSLLERGLMRRRDVRAIAISSFTAGTLGADCHATILPPALSSEWFDTLVTAASSAKANPGFHIVTAFRLDAWREKGLPQLIDAVAALARDDIHLTICGSGNPPEELLRILKTCGWCTLRVGLTDGELAHQFAAADVFVLATRTTGGRLACGEGFGLVLLEAQVAGTAVVAPAHGGSSDAYVEGVTGVAPTDETAEALARALDELLGNPSRLAWMGKRAADWARESFAPERYAELVARRLL
jgi:phosphatidyl-myo-inositol dimannoside synthase